eukprot:9352787-Pyramimonas_sp.AAC.1
MPGGRTKNIAADAVAGREIAAPCLAPVLTSSPLSRLPSVKASWPVGPCRGVLGPELFPALPPAVELR